MLLYPYHHYKKLYTNSNKFTLFFFLRVLLWCRCDIRSWLFISSCYTIMAFITFFTLIVAGLFACYWLIVWKFKSIKDEFDMIVPFQFIFWILLLLFFIYDIFTFGNTIALLKNNLLFWILQIIATVTKLVLWFVLSYWMITKYVLTAPTDTKEKTDKLYKTLIWVQVPFGLIAIFLWVFWLLFMLFT